MSHGDERPKSVGLCVLLQVITFDTGVLPNDATAEQLQDTAIFRDTYLHITSLLHAIAIQTLCSEGPGVDIVMHDSVAQTPAADARREHLGDIFGRTHMGMASWQDIFMLRGRAQLPCARRLAAAHHALHAWPTTFQHLQRIACSCICC